MQQLAKGRGRPRRPLAGVARAKVSRRTIRLRQRARELLNCAAYVESASNAIEGADRGRELARLARKAAGDLDVYEKTAAHIAEVDRRVVGVLMWLDERARNSQSFGSHADAYEIAARKLREAISGREEP